MGPRNSFMALTVLEEMLTSTVIMEVSAQLPLTVKWKESVSILKRKLGQFG
jgi:hypothetical protein